MSTTLSMGYKKPDTGDRGSSFFPDLESNITLVNSHKHDGTDGVKIALKDLLRATSAVASGSWGSDLGGNSWMQTITMPTGYTFDASIISIQDDATGDVLYPTITKNLANSFDIYVNDNTLDLTVKYG